MGEATKTQIAPRFQGNVIPVGKQFGFEVFVTIGPTEPISMTFDKEPNLYLTFEAAMVALKREIPKIVTVVCEAVGAGIPKDLIDLNRNEIKSIEDYENATFEDRNAEQV